MPQLNHTWLRLTCVGHTHTPTWETTCLEKKCFVWYPREVKAAPVQPKARGSQGLTLHDEAALRGAAHPRAGFVGGAHVDAGMLHREVRDHEVSCAQHLDPLHADRAPV